MEKKLLWTGLTLSLLIHLAGLVLLSLPFSKTLKLSKPLRSISVTYQDLKTSDDEKKNDSANGLKIMKDTRPHEDQQVRILEKKGGLFSSLGDRIKDISKLTGKLRTTERDKQKITTLDLDKRITLPPLSAEKITNPKYLTYNDDMRETISRNIKQRAYAYVNHPDFETGEVYLTFVLESGGFLKGVKIIEDKTLANDYLREVALKSITESNPFPPFPKGFDYPEFTFNLLISFQN